MKKVLIVLVFVICVCYSAYAESGDIIKISMDSEVKRAKEFGSGNGISFNLPDLDSSKFLISAIELAVFERLQDSDSWTIYKDNEGIESKKQLIENPASLNLQVDFGNVEDYRENAKYKVAYRYYVKSLDDLSKTVIAGEDEKDGWRLVGEDDGISATGSGFMFYRNAKPVVVIEGISYQAETINGVQTFSCNLSQLGDEWLPSDVFQNGITVDYIADDYDSEDTLTVGYKLVVDNTVIAEGIVNGDDKIISSTEAENVQLILTVTDNWGAISESAPLMVKVDKQSPQVVSQFNDMGRALRGRNLYSKFIINDNQNEMLSSGNVYYTIRRNGIALYQNVRFANNTNGEYTVDYAGMMDGDYEIELTVFDKAYNKTVHTLQLILDNTAPTVSFLTPSDNSDATLYSTWMNKNKKVMFTATDEYAGVKRYTSYLDGSFNRSTSYGSAQNQINVSFDVTSAKTGKLSYYIYVYDNASTVNKTTNTANTSVTGNLSLVAKYVWIDKTPPSVTINADGDVWYCAPQTVYADIYDYPSTANATDNSGVHSKYYTVTETDSPDDNWQIYSDGVTFNSGGVYYLHIKAVDYAGNETLQSRQIKINTPSQIVGDVTPTVDYWHTIYNQTGNLYVVKNTAYNTKYSFTVQDFDIKDLIRSEIRLASQDDINIYTTVSVDTVSQGSVNRDVTFNLPYTKADGSALPDGVYTMYVNVSEVKNDGTILAAHQNIAACEVVIKRSSPPNPVINVASGSVSIEYPLETLANSLNRVDIKTLYKREYKSVKVGDSDSNMYKAYSAQLPIEDMVVTALYTDPAGNIATSTKRIFPEGIAGESQGSIVTDGNTVTIEESRPATVYYIGVRRDKHGGIDENIFNFID